MGPYGGVEEWPQRAELRRAFSFEPCPIPVRAGCPWGLPAEAAAGVQLQDLAEAVAHRQLCRSAGKARQR